MPPSSTNGDVVLRLLDGRSEQRELVLEGGRPIPPLSLGSRGAWTIEGGHVANVHVMLAFNGTNLFVGAFAGEMALLDGFPLGARWTEVRLPSELRFGSARLTICRRAGPEEETQLPGDEMTRFADARAVAPKAVRRLQRDDEVTRFDDERLQEALRLTREDEVTRIAAPPGASTAVMPVVRRPPIHTMKLTRPTTPPPIPIAPRVARESQSGTHLHALPDSERTLAVPAALSAPMLSPLASEASASDEDSDIVEEPSTTSSMPPTIPSDGSMAAALPVMPAFGRPLPVAVSRPSQPTMAIPEPHDEAITAEQLDARVLLAQPAMDSIEAGALAVSGEHTSDTRDLEPTAPGRNKLSALKTGWNQASFPKKAIALLMAPALVLAVFAMRQEPTASARSTAEPPYAVIVAAPQATTTTAATSAVAAPTPATATLIATATTAEPTKNAAAGPTRSAADEPVKAGAPGLRDTRTPERRALDTAASGQDSSAAEQYDALAVAHPENLAFREAARILRERATPHRDP